MKQPKSLASIPVTLVPVLTPFSTNVWRQIKRLQYCFWFPGLGCWIHCAIPKCRALQRHSSPSSLYTNCLLKAVRSFYLFQPTSPSVHTLFLFLPFNYQAKMLLVCFHHFLLFDITLVVRTSTIFKSEGCKSPQNGPQVYTVSEMLLCLHVPLLDIAILPWCEICALISSLWTETWRKVGQHTAWDILISRYCTNL